MDCATRADTSITAVIFRASAYVNVSTSLLKFQTLYANNLRDNVHIPSYDRKFQRGTNGPEDYYRKPGCRPNFTNLVLRRTPGSKQGQFGFDPDIQEVVCCCLFNTQHPYMFWATVPRSYIKSDEPETSGNRKQVEWDEKPLYRKSIEWDKLLITPDPVDNKDDNDGQRFAGLKGYCRDDAAVKVSIPGYPTLYVSDSQIKSIDMQYNTRSFSKKLPKITAITAVSCVPATMNRTMSKISAQMINSNLS
jgi:hypothetical protein